MSDDKLIMRCRDCIFLCGQKTTIGIECMEPALQWKWHGKYYRYHDTARYKRPSHKACRRFQPKAGGEENGELH